MKKLAVLLFFFLLTEYAKAGTTDTVEVYSNAMHKNIKCVIVKPSAYDEKSFRYPVVYLLHGYSGNYAQWINTCPALATKADEMNAIIVCPDGGFGSWYFDSPVDSSIRYETFVSDELVSYIDAKYASIADRRHRAITGLSMGGHGAMYLAIRHRDKYGAAGSTSGGVDFTPFPKNWDIAKDLGDYSSHQQLWQQHTVISQANNLKNRELSIIVDCGIDDFFLQVNRNLHQALLEKKIDHDYIERPGGHDGPYWANSILYQLLFFQQYFSGEK
ncbi:alpha/beta hydrolase [Foetidibacter luteolus]|uniref:alpha/beta hydrolase n=1 Tax=Foetidibacter luteolus TaxID=2608880 RepID=UPI00129B70A4|nr:alpha/beta hydrolase family protein [Foetidibacter luteolus]